MANLARACVEAGARLVERVLERPPVDGEQEVALLHDLAVVEMHLVEIPRYPRTHLDRIDRDKAADILVLVDDAALRPAAPLSPPAAAARRRTAAGCRTQPGAA